VLDSIEKVKEFIDSINSMLLKENKLKLTFDLETTGLNKFSDSVLSLAFTWDSMSAFIPLKHPKSPWVNNSEEVIGKLRFLFEDKRVQLIAQNAKFDMGFMQTNYGIEVKNLWFDTMIAHFLMQGKSKPHGLKSCAWKYTEYGGYEIDVENLVEVDLKTLAT